MSPTILLIEDDEAIGESLHEFLEMSGYSVIQARTGTEGIRLAHLSEPNIILCDVMLPEKTGFEVLSELRGELKHQIPFIFLSASAEEQRIREGLGGGADAYMTKPFLPDELLTLIGRLIK